MSSESTTYIKYSEYLRRNLDHYRLLAYYQNTKFTTTTKESMVLINHNDVHWKRICVRAGKELYDAECQINDNVCKLFHSLLFTYVSNFRLTNDYIYHAKSHFFTFFFS